MDFDDILPEVGEYGKYQKLVLWFLLLPGTFPCGFHAYNQLFMAFVPEHWCKIPELQQSYLNFSSEAIKNLSIPRESGSFSKCYQYDIDYPYYVDNYAFNVSLGTELLANIISQEIQTAKKVPCLQGWHYELAPYTTTVVADFDLVCDRAFEPTLALVLFGASGLIGNYLFGFIQDGWGRRPAFFIYLFLLCLFGVPTAFMSSYYLWLVTRIGVGFTIPSIMVTPFVLAIELVGPAQRTYTTIIMNVAYSFTLITLAVIVYFVRIWSQLALATIIPFLALFGFWSVLPESPRWLLANGRIDEAYKVIETMARVNKKPLRKNFKSFLQNKYNEDAQQNINNKGEERTYGLLDLFRTPNLRKKTLIITFIWFANTSVYVGLSYYAPVLGGDAYLNFFLAGVAELPTYLFLWPSMEYWGRRWTLCFAMVIGGAACIATVLTQKSNVVTLILYCIGKFGISSSYVVLPLFASELYPTVVRGIGLGVSATAGMIGPVVIPLINYLGTEMMVLPLMIMGTLLVIGGLFALLLPETLNEHLPQTIEDGEQFGRKISLNCCPSRKRKSSNSELSLPNQSSLKTNDCEDEFEDQPLNDSYSSLRRNSFLKAQQHRCAPEDEIEDCRKPFLPNAKNSKVTVV